MSLTVFLDAGPLGLVTNPKKTPDTIAAVCGDWNRKSARTSATRWMCQTILPQPPQPTPLNCADN